MNTRVHILVTAIALSILFLISTSHGAPYDGWGIIINRTSKSVSLQLVDSSGRRSTWIIRPNHVLRLRNSSRYTARIGGSNSDRVTLDARMKGPDDLSGAYMSLFSPRWTHIPQPYNSAIRSAWAIRWYQITDVNDRPELRSGFSSRDVDELVESYKRRMHDIGFAEGVALVYEPAEYEMQVAHEERHASEAPSDKALRHAIGISARKLQHEVLADCFLDVLKVGMDTHDKSSDFFDIDLFVGEKEIRGLLPMQDDVPPVPDGDDVPPAPDRDDVPPAPDEKHVQSQDNKYREELLRCKAVVEVTGRMLSPEIHQFVREVVAEIFSLRIQEVGIRVHTWGAAAAPSGPFVLRQELAKERGRVLASVEKEVTSIINDDPFLVTLKFGEFDTFTVSEKVAGETRLVTQLKTTNDWRYHRLTDQVAFMDTHPAMRGMDLRWRLLVRCSLVGVRIGQPEMEAHVELDIETKRRTLSRRAYVPWKTNLSQFWIRPLGSDVGRIDLESVAFRIQNTIVRQCEDDDDQVPPPPCP